MHPSLLKFAKRKGQYMLLAKMTKWWVYTFFTKSWFPLVSYQLYQKNIFINDYHWDIPGLHSQWFSTPEPPQKMFLVIFQGLRLSLGHFGQQALDSPVSQLQNCVSTSFLPPVILGILTLKDYPRSNSFFSMGILEGVKWKTSQADYSGPKQQ